MKPIEYTVVYTRERASLNSTIIVKAKSRGQAYGKALKKLGEGACMLEALAPGEHSKYLGFPCN